MKLQTKLAIFLVTVLAFSALSLTAQVTTGTLYGTVKDESGLVIPGAEIAAVNEATTIRKNTVTDIAGNFTLSFLPAGSYTITVTMPGFKTLTETALVVRSGMKAEKIFTLQVGAPDQVVTVTAGESLINTINAEQDINLNTEQVERLPAMNRDITSILTLGTGASKSWGATFLTLNGLALQATTFSLDGVDASQDVEFPGSISMFNDFNFVKGASLEAVQEVEVSKGVFSAEIGNTLSGNVNVITKSGGNDFHGSAFWYYSSGGLRAVNHFGPTATSSGKEPQVFHQFGGALGGPIIRDKLFFFGNYEGYRLTGKTVQSGLVPSRWLRDQLIGVLPGAETFFSVFELPTGAEQPGAINAFLTAVHAETREDDHFSVRGDYNITNTDFLTGRYTRASPSYLSPRLAIGNSRNFDGIVDNAYVTYNRSWSPTLTSEFRWGLNKNHIDRLDLKYENHVPNLSVAGSVDAHGEAFIKYGFTSSLENTWSWIRGKHALKFGGSIKWLNGHRINEEDPFYTFDTVEAALANQADRASFLFGLKDYELRNEFFGFFVQDDIRLKPNFILNLGLRWDYSGVPNERDGRIFNRVVKAFDLKAPDALGPWRDPDELWKASYNDWGPRISFAWTLDSAATTVLRAGYGIYYTPRPLYSGVVSIIKNSLNESTFLNYNSADSLLAADVRYPDHNEDVRPKATASGIDGDPKMDPNLDSSYSQQWTLGIQRELVRDFVLDVAYIGNHGVKIPYNPLINQPRVRYSGPGLIDATGDLPIPGANTFHWYTSSDSTTYNALQTTLKKRFSKGFSLNTNYTWCSNLSFFRNQLGGSGNSENPQEILDQRENRAPPDFHIRHGFSTDFLWDLPWGSNLGGAARAILGGWSVSGVVQARSGTPILILQRGTRIASFRPDLAGTHESLIYNGWSQALSDATSVHGNACSNHCYWYLDESALSRAPTTTVIDSHGNSYTTMERPGTLSRRPVYGPGAWTVDMSLAKEFSVTETSRLQLRADFYNFFNKTNLGNPSSTYLASNFGRITSAAAGRSVQFSLRYTF